MHVRCLFGRLTVLWIAFLVPVCVAISDIEDAGITEFHATVRLDEGSLIKGILLTRTFPVRTLYGVDLDLSYEWIQSVRMVDDSLEVRLHNGDRLTASVDVSPLRLQTLIGTLELPIDRIRDISISLPDDVSRLPTELHKGLVGYYTFDRDAGSRVDDSSAAERHGVGTSIEWTPEGRVGGAMYFNGKESRIIAPDAGLPTGDASRSFAFWVKLDSPTHNSTLVGYGPRSHNQSCFYGMDWRHGRNSVGFSQWGAVNVPARRMEVGRWYHFVHTYGGSGDHAFYIDGEFVQMGVHEIRSPLNTRLNGTFYIGAQEAEEHGFYGWLDEVLIYDRKLSREEVTQLYAAQESI